MKELDESKSIHSSSKLEPIIFSATIPSFRLTHSDVMCTTITTTRKDWELEEKKTKNKCHYPYMEKQISKAKNSRNDKHLTLLQSKQDEAARLKLNNKLHSEHRAFMENLKKERELRTKVETAAAQTIQRYMRGFHTRESLGLLKNLKRTSFKYTDQQIRDFLIKQAQYLRLQSQDKYELLSYKELPQFTGEFFKKTDSKVIREKNLGNKL